MKKPNNKYKLTSPKLKKALLNLEKARKKLAGTKNKNRQKVATKTADREETKNPRPLAGACPVLDTERAGVGVIKKETQISRDESPTCANAAINPMIAWEEGIAAVILKKTDHSKTPPSQAIKPDHAKVIRNPSAPPTKIAVNLLLSIGLLLGWNSFWSFNFRRPLCSFWPMTRKSAYYQIILSNCKSHRALNVRKKSAVTCKLLSNSAFFQASSNRINVHNNFQIIHKFFFHNYHIVVYLQFCNSFFTTSLKFINFIE